MSRVVVRVHRGTRRDRKQTPNLSLLAEKPQSQTWVVAGAEEGEHLKMLPGSGQWQYQQSIPCRLALSWTTLELHLSEGRLRRLASGYRSPDGTLCPGLTKPKMDWLAL